MLEGDSIYEQEINIGFFGLENDNFKKIIVELNYSTFFNKFSLYSDIISKDKYIQAIIKPIENQNQNQIIEEDSIFPKDENFILNINNFEIIFDNKDKDKQYEQFIKTKIDYFFLFNIENQDINFIKKIIKYSKDNFIIINLNNKNKNEDEKFKSKSFDNFLVNEKDIKENKNKDSKKFIFEKFLEDIKNKFDMFLMFQDYSVEKSIITFKDYLKTLNEYSKIKDEKQFMELFNKFEKFSFNNDYADNTLILLQIMSSDKEMFNKDISFNVKTLECGWENHKLVICELDSITNKFLCHRCKINQNVLMEKENESNKK